MADRLSSQQIALLKEQFDAFDKDGDGKLTKEDTAAIMRSLGQKLSEEEIEAKHKEFDLNGNGTVEFPEYMAAMAKTVMDADISDEEIILMFTMLDQDKDGFLNRSELSKGMAAGGVEIGQELDTEEVDDILANYDDDRDGMLSLEEFGKMMKSEIYGNGLGPVSK